MGMGFPDQAEQERAAALREVHDIGLLVKDARCLPWQVDTPADGTEIMGMIRLSQLAL